MIEFELRQPETIYSWWDVTVGMAPDGIHYSIRDDDRVIDRRGPLPPLVLLLICAREEYTTDQLNQDLPFTLQTSEDDLELRFWDVDEPIETTYNDLRGAIEPFLVETFAALDEQGEKAPRRQEAFDFVSSYTGEDFDALYEELTDRDE